MRRLIVIGTKVNKLGKAQGEILNLKFDELNLIGELKKISVDNHNEDNYMEVISKELKNGKIDIAVMNLPDLPASLPEGLVIGALSQRSDPAELLIISREAFDKSAVLSLQNRSLVAVSSKRAELQLHDLLPDINTVLVEGEVYDRIKMLHNQEIDSSIESAAEIKWLDIDLENFKCLRLNPKEFVPSVGQGVAAYLCREKDTEIRKILSNIHCRTAAKQTNIERKVLQNIDAEKQKSLGVFCEIDKMSNYHAYAVFSDNSPELKRTIVSQSTSFNLPEKIIEQLNK